jgi:hypothetical protein
VAYNHGLATAKVLKALSIRRGDVDSHTDRQVCLKRVTVSEGSLDSGAVCTKALDLGLPLAQLGVGPLCGELGLLRSEIDDLGFGDRLIGHAMPSAHEESLSSSDLSPQPPSMIQGRAALVFSIEPECHSPLVWADCTHGREDRNPSVGAKNMHTH